LSTPVVGVVLIGTPEAESAYGDYYTAVSTSAPGRPKRRRRSVDIDERLEQWVGTGGGGPGTSEGDTERR